ncbi:MAG: hypothetical protein JWO32_1426 [Bacteroidetes bacterium]|nr:hypothetical protein [Bacteroidota bacterium]
MGLFEEIKGILIDRRGRFRKRMLTSVTLCLIGAGICIWFLIRSLYFENHWNHSGDINYTIAGQFGDFIGGLVGTLFSIVGVVLLYETLALQRHESEETRKVLVKQQFENTFFSLLKLYQDSLSKISAKFIFENNPEMILTGLDYFDIKRQELYNNFQYSNSILKNNKSIQSAYIHFYLQNKTQLSIYFRTLYRIYRFIDSAPLDEKFKLEYSKIIRAQLNEDELFFIFYNAHSDFGSKFRPLINKYNITKHLPLMSKIEYKYFSERLNPIERSGVELILEELRKDIRKRFVEKTGKYSYREYLEQKYKFIFRHNENELIIEVNINKLIALRPVPQKGFGIQNFDNDDLEKLILTFLKDIFHYSNFSVYNDGLKISTQIEDETDLTKIKCKVVFKDKLVII